MATSKTIFQDMYVLLLVRPTYGGVVAGTEEGSGGGEVSGTAAHRHNGDRKFAGDIADWMSRENMILLLCQE